MSSALPKSSPHETVNHRLNVTAGGTLSGELTITLRDAIITGEIVQGSKLSETKLAKELDVSRGPLREALRNLEGMNLAHSVPQQGSRVVVLREDTVLQIYEAREALESKAAALAAQNMSSREIDELHRLNDTATRQMKETSAGFFPAETDYAFHETLIKGSGNKVIERALLLELYNLIKMFRYQTTFVNQSSSNALIVHRQIAYAIEQRDAVLAEVTVRRHIVQARERIARKFKELASS